MDVTASIDHAIEEAESFDLRHEEARVIAGEVAMAVANWRTEAKLMGLRSREVEYMETAFEHPEAEIARRW
jgi:serine/threonine-protein kinase HipA